MPNPLIIALDVSSEKRALELVDLLRKEVAFFKVGLQLYTQSGPSVVRKILDRGGRVFLDLKLHDIPNTVANATVEAARLGVQMLTLHALGGERMLTRAREALLEYAETQERTTRPQLVAVTVLTSLSEADLTSLGIDRPLRELALRLAGIAQNCEMDGLVASPHEIRQFKDSGINRLFYVTPAIRPAGFDVHDQVRTMTASEAIAEGADYVVVGRPVIQAPDPLSQVQALLEEIQRAKISR